MDELETLLRQFQPRRPKPLPDVEGDHRAGPFGPAGRRRLVWIAASGLAAAGVLMVVRYQRTPVVDSPDTIAITLGALNTHAVKSLDDLDQVLTRTSAAILPNVERPGGALHALSRP